MVMLTQIPPVAPSNSKWFLKTSRLGDNSDQAPSSTTGNPIFVYHDASRFF
jgi:hypothetical protein